MGKLRLDKRHPWEMNEAEFNAYGAHLQKIQAKAAYFGALGQPGSASDSARKEAAVASKELGRIKYGLGWDNAATRQPAKEGGD